MWWPAASRGARGSSANAGRRSTGNNEDFMAARLREHYVTKVVPALTKEFGYKNPMAVPKIEKISINIGLGEATQNAKLMDGALNELGDIAVKKPAVTK